MGLERVRVEEFVEQFPMLPQEAVLEELAQIGHRREADEIGAAPAPGHAHRLAGLIARLVIWTRPFGLEAPPVLRQRNQLEARGEPPDHLEMPELVTSASKVEFRDMPQQPVVEKRIDLIGRRSGLPADLIDEEMEPLENGEGLTRT